MPQKLFSLVLIMPLLLPQGMCICDLIPQKSTAGTEGEAATEEAPPCCRCHRHQRRRTAEQASTASARSHPHQLPAPVQRDEDHVPGCPAKAGGGLWKHTSRDPHSLTASTFASLAEASPCSLPEAPTPLLPAPIASADPPIYLTLRTLRI
jgi:hypothetical protein